MTPSGRIVGQVDVLQALEAVGDPSLLEREACQRCLARAREVGAIDKLCDWCRGPIPAVSESGRARRSDSKTCCKACRQASWRFRVDETAAVVEGEPMRFAYADPPYPGKAGYYDERTEVDHAELVERLVAEFPHGWALSTSSSALRGVLPLCPRGVRVCVWRRRVRRTRAGRALSAWEPLLVVGGRRLATDRPQELVDDLETADVVLDEVLDYRGRYDAFPGALVGMKPPQFGVWMFGLLGAGAGDELVDLYPGSGAVSEAWRRYTSTASTRDSSRAAA